MLDSKLETTVYASLREQQQHEANKHRNQLSQQHLSSNDQPSSACHRCDVCGKMLSTKLTLKRHKEQQHLQPLNNAICGLCNKVFRTLNSLNNHKSIYHRRQKGHQQLQVQGHQSTGEGQDTKPCFDFLKNC